MNHGSIFARYHALQHTHAMRLAKNLWYPVIESRELRRKPLGVRRLGLDLVFWRNAEGAAVAQSDRCPHLGAALSAGTVENGCITCPFHGIRFDGNGRCTRVPSMGAGARIPDALQARTYPTREQHGLVWLWWGDAAPAAMIPFFDELDSGWSWQTQIVEWPVNYTRAIENQLDVAHLAFVHRTTIGMGGRSRVDGPHVEADETGIRIWTTNRRDDGTPARSPADLAADAGQREATLHLKYPGIWRLNISARLVNFIAFVPVDEGRTLYYLRTYRPGRPGPVGWLMSLVTPLLNGFILDQDRRVVVTQTPGSSLDVRDDHLLGADRAIVEYRKWLGRATAPM